MPLKPFVDTLDGLHEAIQSEYEKREDGKFYLKVEPLEGFALENVSGLKSAISAERNTVATLKNEIKKFEGLDVDAARDALIKVANISKMTPEDKVNEIVEQKTKQIIEKHQGEVTKHKKDYDNLYNQLVSELIDSEAIKSLSEHKLVNNGANLIMPHIKQNIRITRLDDGKFVARVKDSNNPEQDRISMKEGSTSPMSVSEYVSIMSQDKNYAPIFVNQQAKGTDVRTNTRTTPTMDQSTMTPNDYTTNQRHSIVNPINSLANAHKADKGGATI